MKGILFKPWKIKAIADSPLDREWQTRRVIKPQPTDEPELFILPTGTWVTCATERRIDDIIKPRYQTSEVVYIKEAWYHRPNGEVSFKLDDPNAKPGEYWTPLFMPAWAARYFIRITDVRAERTRDITPEDCLKEGIIYDGFSYFYPGSVAYATPQSAYFALYDSINGKDAHKTNWDWVYSFKRTEE